MTAFVVYANICATGDNLVAVVKNFLQLLATPLCGGERWLFRQEEKLTGGALWEHCCVKPSRGRSRGTETSGRWINRDTEEEQCWGSSFFKTEVTPSNAPAFESVKCVNILFDQVTPAAVKSEFSRSVKKNNSKWIWWDLITVCHIPSMLFAFSQHQYEYECITDKGLAESTSVSPQVRKW